MKLHCSRSLVFVALLTASSAAAEHPPAELSARALLKGYWSFPTDWERREVGQPLDVTGFVERVVEVRPHVVALEFDVGEVSYAVRCEMARGEAKKARALSPGQLVVAHGDWRQLLLPVGDNYFCRFQPG